MNALRAHRIENTLKTPNWQIGNWAVGMACLSGRKVFFERRTVPGAVFKKHTKITLRLFAEPLLVPFDDLSFPGYTTYDWRKYDRHHVNRLHQRSTLCVFFLQV